MRFWIVNIYRLLIMNRYFLVVASLLLSITAVCQNFDEYFSDATLRLDYVFAGNRTSQAIYLDGLSTSPRWYGRRVRLDALPLAGNGQITVTDSISGRVVYRHSFSTLFQEWLSTEESASVARSFENVFLVPMPKQTVKISVELFDYHSHVMASMQHYVNPSDVLIRRIDKSAHPHLVLQQPADTAHCINIAFVAEGYTACQMGKFLDDSRRAMEAIFDHEPFTSLRDKFRIVAVESASDVDGTSEPSAGKWLDTVLGSHFDTFYSTRYLTTLRLKRLHDALACVPYEHIIVLVNTSKYGGGGIYNSYDLSYTDGEYFEPVVVHEFGHSFGGLADEYEYSNGDPMYFADTEPWEPNITTKCDFSVKWPNLVDSGEAALIEGGGYLEKGVWRGCPDCRMRTNKVKDFCPVCRQALSRLIHFYIDP